MIGSMREADIMKYVWFIYQADDLDTKALSEAERKELVAQYAAVTATPNVTPGLPTGLPKDAVTVRVRNGETVATPGPYANHWIGGYYVFEAETIEEAIQLASRIPAASRGGAVEVRPAQSYW
jgi:hypothetical protein